MKFFKNIDMKTEDLSELQHSKYTKYMYRALCVSDSWVDHFISLQISTTMSNTTQTTILVYYHTLIPTYLEITMYTQVQNIAKITWSSVCSENGLHSFPIPLLSVASGASKEDVANRHLTLNFSILNSVTGTGEPQLAVAELNLQWSSIWCEIVHLWTLQIRDEFMIHKIWLSWARNFGQIMILMC